MGLSSFFVSFLENYGEELPCLVRVLQSERTFAKHSALYLITLFPLLLPYWRYLHPFNTYCRKISISFEVSSLNIQREPAETYHFHLWKSHPVSMVDLTITVCRMTSTSIFNLLPIISDSVSTEEAQQSLHFNWGKSMHDKQDDSVLDWSGNIRVCSNQLSSLQN